MNEKENKNRDDIEQCTSRDLIIRSSEIAQRGINSLSAPAARTLSFPALGSVGKLFIRDYHLSWGDINSFWWETWKEFGAAKGEIRVPEKKALRLDVYTESARDLSFLQLLKPADLQALYLRNTHVDDFEVSNIRRLTGLKLLSLSTTDITNDGLINLQPLKELMVLGLSTTRITNPGLTNFQHLTELKDLYLRNTAIGDEGLNYIRRFKKLKSIALSGTQVTDFGLEHLYYLRNLQLLDLAGSKVTEEGVTKLKCRLKECQIIFKE